ncbi:MAG: isoprenylcysteine carboxylmethyltransferase family protein [Phycisphaerae bacterium]|nr:isoprenylcysteine carboxylmethyltransferase family protein [Phycisphaerae bacterium]
MTFRRARVVLLRLAFLPIVFVAVFVRPSWHLDSTRAFLVETAGYLFLMLGLSVRIWSILYVGGRKSQVLVTDGPYSLCRNPLYVGTLLLTVGAGLCFENLLMLGTMLATVVPAHVASARLEAAHLAAKFPLEYPPYARAVPAFWPRLKNYRSRETLIVSARAIGRIAIDTAGVILIPEIEDILELLHQHGILPVLWFFP